MIDFVTDGSMTHDFGGKRGVEMNSLERGGEEQDGGEPEKGKMDESNIINVLVQCEKIFERKIECLKVFLSILTLVCVLAFGILNNGANSEVLWKNNNVLMKMFNYTMNVINKNTRV